MSYPTISSAKDVWSLRDVYKAEAGGDWPFPVPTAPTTVTAEAGDAEATVTFSGQVTYGDSPTFTVTSSPGGITATGGSSPITVTGLTNDTEYTFTVTVTDNGGQTVTSSASNAVTPVSNVGGPNQWNLVDGLDDITRININGTAYTGADITQARLEQLFNNSGFQDTGSTGDDYLFMAPTAGESITIAYNAPGTTQVSLRLQRVSGTDVSFTVSGDVSFSNSVSATSVVFTSAAPSSGEFTITTNNNSNGLIVWGISFNGVNAGDLTYG